MVADYNSINVEISIIIYLFILNSERSDEMNVLIYNDVCIFIYFFDAKTLLIVK